MPQQKYKDILKKIISFDTTSHLSNLQIIDYIKEYLDIYNVKTTIIPDQKEKKAALYATIGPKSEPGIGLSAHTDVVPVTEQNWETDPFQLTEKHGRFYGRGTCDMKGFLACVLASVPDFISRDLKRPVHLLFSYDEEIGCIGVRPMINMFGKELVRPKFVIVGEPTFMKVVNAHKSIQSFVTEVTGHEAHSSVLENGVNAIYYSSLLIIKLNEIAEKLKLKPDTRFSPPYSSIHVGKIQGGTARNIVPKKCQFMWEIRGLPKSMNEEIVDEFQSYCETLIHKMRETYDKASIMTNSKNHVRAFSTSEDSNGNDLISLAMKWAGQNDTHAVSYATEAGLFEQGMSPTIVCGPGDIQQAHKPNEYVEIEQLNKCMDFLSKVADYAENGK